ncbi:MAG: spermidine synthase [Pseudomonadota bacterium]
MVEELAFDESHMGEISLRKRFDTVLKTEVFEVKLGDEFLMSSAFTAGEIALSQLALKEIQAEEIHAVVGGLGLGYTAHSALEDQRIASLTVIEALSPVIDWHRQHLVPLGKQLSADSRCRFEHADFFALATAERGFANSVGEVPNLILLDIDHSPSHRLTEDDNDFYQAECLALMAQQLQTNGLFAMWSNEKTDQGFLNVLEQVFETASAHIVSFDNPYSGGESSNTIYIARK